MISASVGEEGEVLAGDDEGLVLQHELVVPVEVGQIREGLAAAMRLSPRRGTGQDGRQREARQRQREAWDVRNIQAGKDEQQGEDGQKGARRNAYADERQRDVVVDGKERSHRDQDQLGFTSSTGIDRLSSRISEA